MKMSEAYSRGTIAPAIATVSNTTPDTDGKVDGITSELSTVSSNVSTIMSTTDDLSYRSPQVTNTSSAVIANGITLFTVSNGWIRIIELMAFCYENNDNTPTTMQYNCTPTIGAATTISGVSSQLTSLLAGASVVLQGKTLATAPAVNISGASLSASGSIGILVPQGTIDLIVADGPTMGTWKHYIKYEAIEAGATVTAGF